MEARETYEEKVSKALDVLYDGALLLTAQVDRAESLVVSVVTGGVGGDHRALDADGFRKWIVARLVRQYIEYVDMTIERSGDPEPEASELDLPPGAGAPGRTGLDELIANFEHLDASSAERLGYHIREQLGELDIDPRAAIWLVSVMCFTYAEAAAALGLRRVELREALFRGRKELQVRLAIALQQEMPGRAGRAG